MLNLRFPNLDKTGQQTMVNNYKSLIGESSSEPPKHDTIERDRQRLSRLFGRKVRKK